MRVRIGQYDIPWSRAEGTWYHDHRDEEFEVVAIHDGITRLYELDVRHLSSHGQIDVARAFVPATFAEEVDEPSSLAVARWKAAS